MAFQTMTREELYTLLKLHPNFKNDLKWTGTTKQQFIDKLNELRTQATPQKRSINDPYYSKDHQRKKLVQRHVSKIIHKRIGNTKDRIRDQKRPKCPEYTLECACNKRSGVYFTKHSQDECVSYSLLITGSAHVLVNINRCVWKPNPHKLVRWGPLLTNHTLRSARAKSSRSQVLLSHDGFRLPHVLQIPDAYAKYRTAQKQKYVQQLIKCDKLTDLSTIILEYL
jgi:hypothetical protein